MELEMQIQNWTAKLLPCLTSIHPFHKPTNLQARAGGQRSGLCEEMVVI